MKRKLFALLMLVVLIALPISGVMAQEEEEAEKIQITFWHAMSGGRIDYIDRMVADFNYTHPDIEVTVEFKGSYRETMNAALLGAEQGIPPHVVHFFEVGTQEALDTGIFIPAADIAGEDILLLGDFIPAVSSYYTLDGKLSSFPFNSSNPVLYYNKDMLEAAGFDPEAPPQTFEDMLDVCEAIVGGGVAESCITWPFHSWFVEQWVAEQGALLADNENGRAGRATEVFLDSEAMNKIVSWWKELYEKDYYSYSGTLEDWAGSRQIFISGQSAMLISSTSDVTQMQNAAAEQGFALGTGFLPIPADVERQGVVIGGGTLWLTDGHPQEELEAALEFALWMSNTENTIRWHKGTGYFPVRNSAVEALEAQRWFEKNPAYRQAFDQLLQTKVSPATAGAILGPFRDLRTIIEETIQSVLLEGAEIEAALADADEQADAAVTEYNALVE